MFLHYSHTFLVMSQLYTYGSSSSFSFRAGKFIAAPSVSRSSTIALTSCRTYEVL